MDENVSTNGNGTDVPALVGEVSMQLPDVWDRKGDMVVQFVEHLDGRWRIAKAIAASGLTAHRKPEAILAIQLAAYEVGLPLMQALRGMYMVGGKLALEGHLMDALAIQRCGVTKTIVKRDWDGCAMVLHRSGWDDVQVSFDLEDAKRAGLVSDWDVETTQVKSTKTPWRTHPRNMLYWRTLSDGLKIIAPDFFGGIYTTDELEHVADAHVVAGTPSVGAELDALEQAKPSQDEQNTETPDLFES